MKMLIHVLLSVAIVLLGCLTARAQENEAEAKRFAEEAIKIGAIDYLTDRDFKLDGEHVKATARTIDPKKDVKVKLKEFELLPGSVKLKFRISARFRYEGSITVDDKTTDVHGEANIGQMISLEARYFVDDRGVHVDAKATDMKFSVKVNEMTPDDAAGGKTAVAKLVSQQLRRQKEELLRAFNEWQAEYQRKVQ